MNEHAHTDSELSGPTHSQLRYLSGETPPLVLHRHPLAAARLAADHEWLIDRVTRRVAAWWPEEIDRQALRREAAIALQQTAASISRVEDFPEAAVGALDRRMRHLLTESEWYRQAMVERLRPLYEAWRGAIIAGREPSDHTLISRLRLSLPHLTERFMEMAIAFALEPAAMLPTGVDARYGIAEILMELPTDQQLTAALYCHQELNFPEIARVLSIAPERAQELFGRAATGIVAEAGLSEWPGRALTA